MTENTKIEWAHHTHNHWIGCTKVGPGCDHCYAESLMDTRLGRVRWGAGQPRTLTSEANRHKPLQWDWKAGNEGVRYRVFCSSLSDVFDNEVDPAWREDLFALIRATPNLDWLLLTKRIGLAERMLPPDWGDGYPNVWLGATVVNQEEADRDIPKLLATPARVRFLSMEPLLGPVDLRRFLDPWTCSYCEFHGCVDDSIDIGTDADPRETCPRCGGDWQRDAGFKFRYSAGPDSCRAMHMGYGIDWVIAGGESGPHARPMHPDWARSLRDQCQAAGVPFLFKQWGEWAPCDRDSDQALGVPSGYKAPDGGRLPNPGNGFCHGPAQLEEMGCAFVARVGKTAAGRMLDGRTWHEVPA